MKPRSAVARLGRSSTRRRAAVPMARPPAPARLWRAVVESARKPRRFRPRSALAVGALMGGLFFCAAGSSAGAKAGSAAPSDALRQKQLAQLQTFFAAKERQTQTLSITAGEEAIPEIKTYFAAGQKGDWQTMDDLWRNFIRPRMPQYEITPRSVNDPRFSQKFWGTVVETWGAWDQIAHGAPKYTQMFGDEIIRSIPAGSIYFGGTDPGRFLITAMSKSHADGDPFFTLTQNALADPTYQEYLRAIYGGKIHALTEADSQTSYVDYSADFRRRWQHDQDFPNEPRQLKPGEYTSIADGQLNIRGMAAVMSINATLARIIFDNNPGREFYVEISFPLDWMSPHLEPHGLILQIDRQAPAPLSLETIERDQKYWAALLRGMIGDWLTADTPLKSVTRFTEKVYLRKDLAGFSGDPQFVNNDYATRTFSKLRESIASLYAWRLGALTNFPTPAEYLPKSAEERERLARAADLGFRQSLALCPANPEANFNYIGFLTLQNRPEDAALLRETAAHFDTHFPR